MDLYLPQCVFLPKLERGRAEIPATSVTWIREAALQTLGPAPAEEQFEILPLESRLMFFLDAHEMRALNSYLAPIQGGIRALGLIDPESLSNWPWWAKTIWDVISSSERRQADVPGLGLIVGFTQTIVFKKPAAKEKKRIREKDVL